MRQSYTEKHIAQNTVMVNYLESEDSDGRDTYFYIAVRADNMPKFQNALVAGNFDPEEYGQVLTSGYGEPSPELRAQMAIDYGCKHDAAIELSLEG